MNGGDRNQFGKFITALREQQKVSLDQLCSGLCSVSMITRIGNGERMPGKLLRDRLLSRLGVAPDGYENFLPLEDYRNWKARQQILRLITVRDMDGAKQALERYQKEYNMGDKLERQFYLSMQVQLDRMGGAADELLREKFREAVLLTVPEVEGKSVKEMLLSVQELNLVLEYERYQSPDNLEQRYREMLEYIESSNLDALSRAKIYPKAVFYLYQHSRQKGELTDKMCNQMLVLCNKAVKMLRETRKMYYILEILEIRKAMLQKMMDGLAGKGELGKVSALEPMRRETEEWIRMFGSFYEEYGVLKEMYEYCYLYVEKAVYCISDVIRARRKMTGKTQRELSENICSEKTLGRLERDGVKTQREIIEGLFLRLNLSAEYCKKKLVTDSQEALLLLKELDWYNELRDFEKTGELISRLEKMVPMDIPSNRQVIEYYRVSSEWDKGTLSNEEYFCRMMGVLEITLPQKAMFYAGEKYMTKMEQTCLYNILLIGDGFIQKYSKILSDLYEAYEKENLLDSFIGMYEIVMNRIVSCLGNIGEYERSDAINKKVIRRCLINRRAYILDSCVYSIVWNNNQRQKEGIPFHKCAKNSASLQNCILLSRFCRTEYSEIFYKKKMESQMEK